MDHTPFLTCKWRHTVLTGVLNHNLQTNKITYSLIPSSIPADGSSGFKAESGRYHIYVSLACPWAHRTLIVRKIKGLEDVISVTVVDWFLAEKGWNFTDQVSIVNTMISLLNFKTIITLYIFSFYWHHYAV